MSRYLWHGWNTLHPTFAESMGPMDQLVILTKCPDTFGIWIGHGLVIFKHVHASSYMFGSVGCWLVEWFWLTLWIIWIVESLTPNLKNSDWLIDWLIDWWYNHLSRSFFSEMIKQELFWDPLNQIHKIVWGEGVDPRYTNQNPTRKPALLLPKVLVSDATRLLPHSLRAWKPWRHGIRSASISVGQ